MEHDPRDDKLQSNQNDKTENRLSDSYVLGKDSVCEG